LQSSPNNHECSTEHTASPSAAPLLDVYNDHCLSGRRQNLELIFDSDNLDDTNASSLCVCASQRATRNTQQSVQGIHSDNSSRMQATTAPMVHNALPALVACTSAMVSISIQVATTAWASSVSASGPCVASSAVPNLLPTALAPHAPPPPSEVQAADQVATAFCLPRTAYPCAPNTTLKNLIDTS
jgi:hypothetical protein